MGILIAAVVLLTALALFNLVLTLALVRRLRQAEDSARDRVEPSGPNLAEIPAGSRIPEFTASTTTGATVSSETLLGDRAVYAFFDTGCGVCRTQLQPLVDSARAAGLAPGQVIAFVGDSEGNAEAYTSVLEGHATVVLQELHEGLGKALSLAGVPAFVLADADGVVLRSGVEAKDLGPALVGV